MLLIAYGGRKTRRPARRIQVADARRIDYSSAVQRLLREFPHPTRHVLVLEKAVAAGKVTLLGRRKFKRAIDYLRGYLDARRVLNAKLQKTICSNRRAGREISPNLKQILQQATAKQTDLTKLLEQAEACKKRTQK